MSHQDPFAMEYCNPSSVRDDGNNDDNDDQNHHKTSNGCRNRNGKRTGNH